MNRILQVMLHLVLGISLAVCAGAQDDEKPVKINDGISMVPATGNVYLVKTRAGDVLIDTAIAEIAGEVKKILDSEPHGAIKYIILTHAHADHINFASHDDLPLNQVFHDSELARVVDVSIHAQLAVLIQSLRAARAFHQSDEVCVCRREGRDGFLVRAFFHQTRTS